MLKGTLSSTGALAPEWHTRGFCSPARGPGRPLLHLGAHRAVWQDRTRLSKTKCRLVEPLPNSLPEGRPAYLPAHNPVVETVPI